MRPIVASHRQPTYSRLESRTAREAIAIPADFDYRQVGGLSAEACDVMTRLRPETIGQANRLPGLTPAAVMAVLRHLKRAPSPATGDAGQQAAGRA